jgi:DNA (cytosine-5)-methyltransferase 3A
MNVLSLFDGISCARVALDRAGIEVNAYMASEIEKNAIKVSEKNYPDIIRVGDVVRLEVEGQVDLLIGGSPCTDLSIAKKDRKGLEGDKSCLFWEFVRIKKECNPQWFVLENVASMPKADRDIITREIGVEPVMFNASLVSAQCRKRLFWTNIPFDLPADRGILIKDILEADVDEKFYVKKPMTATLASVGHLVKVGHVEPNVQGNRVYSTEGKATALSAEGGGLAGGTTLVKQEERIRKLTPIECERLQGLPDNYTEGVATTHRYRCLGNAFNCDVVAHILSRVKLMYSRVVNP